MKIDYKKLFFYIVITILIGGIPSIFVITNNVYDKLNKPPLSPPGVIFPIVWTILFILMGISIYRANYNKDNSFNPNIIYFTQLIVNALWTPIFFGLNAYLFAFIWIILLIILVIYMVYKFYYIDHLSAYLNIPYIIWLLFASYLNLFIYILN
ncbi:MAG: tryptophan-rich sensory protein [Bacilli bacterium]|nr:tryptophan-rich sensory protein [Bacilli bacterium]